MMKKTIASLLCLGLLAGLLTGCGGGASSSGSAPSGASSAQAPEGTFFSDSDYKDVTGETPNAVITLDGGSGSISDTTRGSSGSTVIVTAKGIYRVTGSSDGVTIRVSDSKESGSVYLVLDHVTMTGEQPCIDVEAADKVILQCVGENSLTSTGSDSAPVTSRDDLTVNGSGSLTLTSAKHGLVCKDDLILTGSKLTVQAEAIGLKANDSVRIDGASAAITSGHDGIQVDSDAGDGYFYLASGEVAIEAGYDGVDVGTSQAASYTGYIHLAGGSLSISAGGGSSNAKGDTSQKGLKCDGDVFLSGGTALAVSSADDAIHAKGSVTVSGGKTALSTSDDGIHAAGTLTVSGGDLGVAGSYEGLEAETVVISGGNVAVYASDDGVNAAGGSDSSSDERGPWGSGSTGTITVSGGSLYVNAGGDGLDSNGSIYVTGGTTIVEGPTNSGNGAIDKGDGAGSVASITGGTVLAIGSAGMAVNFDSGTQCSALVAISGSAGDTITVDDGSGFSFTASKDFSCAVYSSPSLAQGSTYTLTAGSSAAALDFTSGLYCSGAGGMGGGFGGGRMGGGGPFDGSADGRAPDGGMTPPEGGFPRGEGGRPDLPEGEGGFAGPRGGKGGPRGDRGSAPQDAQGGPTAPAGTSASQGA